MNHSKFKEKKYCIGNVNGIVSEIYYDLYMYKRMRKSIQPNICVRVDVFSMKILSKSFMPKDLNRCLCLERVRVMSSSIGGTYVFFMDHSQKRPATNRGVFGKFKKILSRRYLGTFGLLPWTYPLGQMNILYLGRCWYT